MAGMAPRVRPDPADDPDAARRSARARIAAYAMHAKRPDIAAEAGRKGGEATTRAFPYGPKAWGVAMAARRWNRLTVSQFASRVPMAGSGSEEGGASEPGPVTALSPLPKQSRNPEKT